MDEILQVMCADGVERPVTRAQLMLALGQAILSQDDAREREVGSWESFEWRDPFEGGYVCCAHVELPAPGPVPAPADAPVTPDAAP